MVELVKSFQKNESGATAIEYGLIAALISVALIATFPTLKTAFQTSFDGIAKNMEVK